MELLACIREQKVYLCNLIPLPMGKKCAIEAGNNLNVKKIGIRKPWIQRVISSNSEF